MIALGRRTRRRYHASRRLLRFLVKQLRVRRVPAIRISRAVNICLSPVAYLKRRHLARAASASTSDPIRIAKGDGYAFVSAREIPEIPPAIDQARRVYEAAERDGGMIRYHGGKSQKDFLLYATQGAEAGQYHDIMRLALSRPVLDAVTDYLGSVPIINNVAIMVSIPNDREERSQLYHLDTTDERQVKLFVFVNDVDADCGPFTFVPAEISNAVIERLYYDRGRLGIAEVESITGAAGRHQVVGPPGTAVLVDTARCLHRGSNKNKKPRVAILIQYTDYAVPEQLPTIWPVDRLDAALGLDETQRLALSV